MVDKGQSLVIMLNDKENTRPTPEHRPHLQEIISHTLPNSTTCATSPIESLPYDIKMGILVILEYCPVTATCLALTCKSMYSVYKDKACKSRNRRRTSQGELQVKIVSLYAKDKHDAQPVMLPDGSLRQPSLRDNIYLYERLRDWMRPQYEFDHRRRKFSPPAWTNHRRAWRAVHTELHLKVFLWKRHKLDSEFAKKKKATLAVKWPAKPDVPSYMTANHSFSTHMEDLMGEPHTAQFTFLQDVHVCLYPLHFYDEGCYPRIIKGFMRPTVVAYSTGETRVWSGLL